MKNGTYKIGKDISRSMYCKYKDKGILALEITNEKVHDGRRILTKLVNSYVNK